ncbi:MAG: type B 50S ribosomal protein L31 [Candidatus Protochlamydia sp.]|nr:type B 50S ribosomal protein L31 [Candidatus Protochlamydia sp.]
MKKNTHPSYQKVLFVDSASGYRFVCGSTLQTEAKEKFEGEEYPVSYLSISSTSHPFFTGSKQLVDSEGRVEKFKKRFGRKEEVAKDDSEQESGSDENKETTQEKPAAKKGAAAKSTKK